MFFEDQGIPTATVISAEFVRAARRVDFETRDVARSHAALLKVRDEISCLPPLPQDHPLARFMNLEMVRAKYFVHHQHYVEGEAHRPGSQLAREADDESRELGLKPAGSRLQRLRFGGVKRAHPLPGRFDDALRDVRCGHLLRSG
ncbi:MAG: hypothetical protein HY216_01925 [Candidatus Rokubacteria bacterium]|nr:hypothetical protein [Candidatus Rokubacteria bacterium]